MRNCGKELQTIWTRPKYGVTLICASHDAPPFHEYLLMICKYTPSNLPSLTVSNVKYNGMFKES